MKLLVAGGRNYRIKGIGLEFLDELHKKYNFTELVNGMATGIDESARIWAKANNIPIREFPADWSLGKRGGPERNAKMARYCREDGVCVCFMGNRGTLNMLRMANIYNMITIDLMDRNDLII